MPLKNYQGDVVFGAQAPDGQYYPVAVTAPVAATSTLTSDNTNVADGATVTLTGPLGVWAYVFRTTITGTTAERQVAIGADADTSLANLIAEANGGKNTNPYGTYAAVSGHATVFTANASFIGTPGNQIVTTETSTHLSWTGTYLTGGTNAVLKVDATISTTAESTAEATAAAPSYSEGQDAPLSQTLAGNLRVTDSQVLAKLPTPGTAGTASANVVTVQGIASGTTLPVTATIAAAQTIATVTAVTAITNALPAGTNLLGKTGIDQTTPGTTNGIVNTGNTKNTASTYSPSLFQNLGANATLNVKASAGNVFSLTCYNANAAARYIQLHNTATVPTTTVTVPIFSFLVPTGSQTVIGSDFFTDDGCNFATGIAFAFSTTRDVYTAGSAGDQSTYVQYK